MTRSAKRRIDAALTSFGAVIAAILLTAGPAVAHEGDGEPGAVNEFLHSFTLGADHLLLLSVATAAVLLAGAGLSLAIRRDRDPHMLLAEVARRHKRLTEPRYLDPKRPGEDPVPGRGVD